MSENTYNSIFIKQSEIKTNQRLTTDQTNETCSPLSKKEIMESIPENCLKVQNVDLSKTNAEWRWRFFKFPNKKNEVIEMSYKQPNKNRKYINKDGEWVEREIGDEFDKFVISEYYHYTPIPIAQTK